MHNSDVWYDSCGQEAIWDSHFSRNLVLGDRLICLYSGAVFTNKHQIRKTALGFGCCHCFPLLQMFSSVVHFVETLKELESITENEQ